MRRVILFLGIPFLFNALVIADDFLGADAVLKRLAALRSEPVKARQPQKPKPLEELVNQFAAYQTESETMPPEQAAARWLDLFDRFLAFPRQALNDPRNYSHPSNGMILNTPFTAMPPPAAWDLVAKALEERAGRLPKIPTAACQVLAAILRGDGARGEKAVEALWKAIPDAPDPLSLADISLSQLDDPRQMDPFAKYFAKLQGRDIQLSLFEATLARRESQAVPNPAAGMILIADLLRLAGPEKARALARRTLALGADLSTTTPGTERIFSEIALQDIELLKRPYWILIRDLKDVPLYEAMRKRFPGNSWEDRISRSNADMVYLAALITENRTEEAVTLWDEMQPIFRQLREEFANTLFSHVMANRSEKALNAFLRERLASDPSLPYWQKYIDLSARLGESDDAFAFLREVATQPDREPEVRNATEECYLRALFAADRLDEGIDFLRGMIETGTPELDAANQHAKEELPAAEENFPSEELRRQWSSESDLRRKHVALCLRLGRIGALTGRNELVEEGITGAREAIPPAFGRGFDHGLIGEIAEFLVSQRRYAEAQVFVTNAMKKSVGDASELKELFEMLAVIYDQAGRFEDVMLLLDGGRDWELADVSGFSRDEQFGVPLMLVAARALLKSGKTEQARRAIHRVIEAKPGYDPAYSLLLNLADPDTENYLDRISKWDRFEQRPLIWKARVQLEAGRVEEAERTVRSAIAIDPSDGEQGKGDRMRAYTVLADVLDKKGAPEQAKTMRAAVEAIRLSEDADDWWTAGLLTRAVTMDERALGHFAGAYCIQSRLANRYSEFQESTKAREHYERAFELMPDSIGRAEPRCFGWENAFGGTQALEIAGRVFTRLAEKMPNKPQVFYLLGYVRQQEGKPEEAAAQYRKAVKLDPDYLSAWCHLLKVSVDAPVPQADLDAATLALLRLDPTMRYPFDEAIAGFDKIANLRAFWDGIVAAEKARPPIPSGAIYSLAASKEMLEIRLSAAREAGNTFMEDQIAQLKAGELSQSGPPDLRMLFARQEPFESLINFLEAGGER